LTRTAPKVGSYRGDAEALPCAQLVTVSLIERNTHHRNLQGWKAHPPRQTCDELSSIGIQCKLPGRLAERIKLFIAELDIRFPVIDRIQPREFERDADGGLIRVLILRFFSDGIFIINRTRTYEQFIVPVNDYSFILDLLDLNASIKLVAQHAVFGQTSEFAIDLEKSNLLEISECSHTRRKIPRLI
jgi:hypothetical protein